MSVSPITQELVDEDDPQFHALFKEVFGSDISDALVHWKYGGERGRRYGVFAEDHRLLAHCGLTFRRALVEGQSNRIAQLGDLMATRRKPGGLTRGTSVFHHLIAHVYASVQTADNPDALTFGFPSGRSMKLGEQLGLAVSQGAMHELVFIPELEKRSWWRLKEVAQFGDAFDRMANRLWSAMAAGFRSDVLCVRDAAHLRYRYLEHPEHRYVVYRVDSLLGQPSGLVFCKRQGDELEVMDIVASRGDLSRVLSTLQRRLAALAVRSMKIWVTDRHAETLAKSLAFTSVPLEFKLVVNHNSSGGNLQRFEGRWWLTGGDTDYR